MEQDLRELKRLVSFLVSTVDDVTMIEADDSGILFWHVDVPFETHNDDKRGQNGSMYTMGKGCMLNGSTKTVSSCMKKSIFV